MSRLLFLGLVIFVVYLLIRFFRKRKSGDAVSGQAEDMVCCVHCGVHLPRNEAILASGKFYCSEAHRRDCYDKSDHA